MLRRSVRTLLLGLCFAPLTVVAACGISTWPASIHPADGPVPVDAGRDAYLKVHTHAGELYVLSSWADPEDGAPLSGSGVRYDERRAEIDRGPFEIARADIALLETNEREVVSRFAYSGLMAFSTLSAATTFICLADPKSCFGSCPTFYTSDDPDRPVAEGFSSSFARVLEERDVDDLGLTAPPGPVELVMRNEAMETHAVRHVRLLAVPATGSGPVARTADGALVATRDRQTPLACTSPSGSCVEEVRARDDRELTSETDADDLGVREEVIVTFADVSGPTGVLLTARNSLVTTFVFYQSLAYAGREVGDVLAALERGEPGVEERVLGIARELGGIEVLVSADGAPWQAIGTFGEAGPIAADQHLFPIEGVEAEELRVMLRMAKGSWRVDEVAVAGLGEGVRAVALEPDSITVGGRADPSAGTRLADPDQYLVTVPGDAYHLWFTVPEGAHHQLFLDSRGYYYEWMREGWLADESASGAATVMFRPREALRMMAPGFKAIEGEMERLFWSSRFRGDER